MIWRIVPSIMLGDWWDSWLKKHSWFKTFLESNCHWSTTSRPGFLTIIKLRYCYKINDHTEMIFCYQNCSDQLWEKIVVWSRKTFEIRGWRPRICKKIEITWTIYSNSERSQQFLATECFFNLFLKVSQI